MPKNLPPLIALEEHFLSKNVEPRHFQPMLAATGVRDQVYDLGARRLADMDTHAVTMQVISHVCGFADNAEYCSLINNELASAVREHPTRFAGFAYLPMADPHSASRELRRCITELGFKGAMIDNHVNGRYFAGAEYDAFWATVQELDVVVYLHPTFATDDMLQWYSGPYPMSAVNAISGPAFGFHFDTAMHLLRLYAAGIFDRFPRLKIILGHFGESLPFWRERIASTAKAQAWGPITRSFDQVYDENLWFTSSGCDGVAAMVCMLKNTKIDRILFSVDYPFVTMEKATRWLRKFQEDKIVNADDLAKICHKNAQKLLNLGLFPN